MHVTFWGTRGSISTPGRGTEKYGGNTPCVSVRYKDAYIILDAGTGIRNLGLELMEILENPEKSLALHLFLSHTHWDHIQGLPFFQPAYMDGIGLTVYGSPKKESFLEAVLKGQMDVEYFPVSMSSLAADLKIQEISDAVLELNDVIIDWQEQVLHPGGSVGYRLRVGDKVVVYATDVELDRIYSDERMTKESPGLLANYIRFIHNADLLIADGQYTEEEYPVKRGWGHTSIPVILDLAEKAEVKQLAVFHHDPQHSDKILDGLWRKYAERSKGKDSSLSVFWAREGMTLAI
jgi:phosphoribosyl 1,2-cyclic phosphodiesterase